MPTTDFEMMGELGALQRLHKAIGLKWITYNRDLPMKGMEQVEGVE